MTTIRALRLISNSSLDELCDQIGVARSHLSVLERFGNRRNVGRGLKGRIERHFGLPFDTLTAPVDTDAVSAFLRELVTPKVAA